MKKSTRRRSRPAPRTDAATSRRRPATKLADILAIKKQILGCLDQATELITFHFHWEQGTRDSKPCSPWASAAALLEAIDHSLFLYGDREDLRYDLMGVIDKQADQLWGHYRWLAARAKELRGER